MRNILQGIQVTGVTGPHEEELEDAGLLTTQRINYPNVQRREPWS